MTYIPKIKNSRLADDAVTSDKILDGEVTTGDLHNGAVTSAKLGFQSVDDLALGLASVGDQNIKSDAGIQLSKLATDPLARENHTGTQLASTISDFDAQVQTNSLDEMAAPVDHVYMGGWKLTNVGTPENNEDAANKAYVDSVAMGLDVKASVLVATQGNIDLMNVPATIDGISMSAGDRVLVKDQNNPVENGIYAYPNTEFSTQMMYAIDADDSADVNPGMFTFVEKGTNADQGWVLTTDGPILLGTTPLTFSQFSNAVIVSTLDSLTDVDASGAAAGTPLVFNGSSWDVAERVNINPLGSLGSVAFENGAGITENSTSAAELELYGDLILLNSTGRAEISGDAGVYLDGRVLTRAQLFDPVAESTSEFIVDEYGTRLYVILVDTSSEATSVLLPEVVEDGRVLQIKDAAGSAETNALVVDANGNMIDNDSSFTLDTNWQSVTIVGLNGNWFVI